MSTRDRPSDPYATEAKEFLRKKLVGRDVEVKMEYTRKIPGTAGMRPTSLQYQATMVLLKVEG